jgi:Domain of unknown function (DUF7007)
MKRSPWGPVQDEREVAPGITSVSTASHGGFKLNRHLNEGVPDYMREPSGWYEEDVDWAVVATVYPGAFSEADQRHARDTLRNWRPDIYERFFGEEIPPGQSHVKDERRCLEEHRGDYIGMAAFGDWKAGVPKGYVGIFAGRGGRRPDGRYPEDTAWFLVPEGEYTDRTPCGFVVDESRYERVAPLD